MNTQLQHIFDQSACLTRTQTGNYINGLMGAEECHAAEHHLSQCPICNESIEGMRAHQYDATHIVLDMNTGFLKNHFILTSPQVHLNSLAPGRRVATGKRKAVQPVWRNSFLAVFVLIGLGLLWYLEKEKVSKEKVHPTAITAPATNTISAIQPISATEKNQTASVAIRVKATRSLKNRSNTKTQKIAQGQPLATQQATTAQVNSLSSSEQPAMANSAPAASAKANVEVTEAPAAASDLTAHN